MSVDKTVTPHAVQALWGALVAVPVVILLLVAEAELALWAAGYEGCADPSDLPCRVTALLRRCGESITGTDGAPPVGSR
ncbi:hypothetical protein ACN20G_09950 [Streptomyces sp. BI20]|uniref:hypothetical protein n=1 Tax=Streptomyces sp. BI20 TaxID=3403460 RepID=UPI003C7289E8